jgi:hypothetical protein
MLARSAAVRSFDFATARRAADDLTLHVLVDAIAEGVATKVKSEVAAYVQQLAGKVQPVLLTLKDAAVYLGRSEQAVRRGALPSKVQGYSEDRELAVASRLSPSLSEAFLTILLQRLRREPSNLDRSEVWPDVRLDAPFENLLRRRLQIGVRVFEYIVEELSAGGVADRDGSQLAASFPAENLIAELLGLLKIRGTRERMNCWPST